VKGKYGIVHSSPTEVSYFMKIEIEKEEDGRWIAEIPELPGVIVTGIIGTKPFQRQKHWP